MLLEKSYGDVCARSTAGRKCREEKRFRSNRLFSRGFPRPRQKSSEITLARNSIRAVLTANQTRIFFTRSIRFFPRILSTLVFFNQLKDIPLARELQLPFENFCTYVYKKRGEEDDVFIEINNRKLNFHMVC